jgi:hypothetical protein
MACTDSIQPEVGERERERSLSCLDRTVIALPRGPDTKSEFRPPMFQIDICEADVSDQCISG